MPIMHASLADLHVLETGPLDRPAILFSNSLGTTYRMWDAVVEILSDDFRCVRYDTRGHGRSTTAVASWNIDDLADDAVAILDGLGIETVHFAGLSLGGMVGQALATRHPMRLRSLTLLATAAWMPPPERWFERARLVRREGMAAVEMPSMDRWFTPAFRALQPETVARFAGELRALDPHGYASTCEAIAGADLRARVTSIDVSTSVVAGRDDPATPVDMVRELHDAIPRADWTILAPASHLLAIERPQEVADHLRTVCDRAARIV